MRQVGVGVVGLGQHHGDIRCPLDREVFSTSAPTPAATEEIFTSGSRPCGQYLSVAARVGTFVVCVNCLCVV